MIRVAILDAHPATRAGLEAILRAAPGVVPVGAAEHRRALLPLLYRADPDVVVVDDVRACLTVRSARVVVHATGVDVVRATFAGAAALVDKAAPAHELLAAVRGERPLPPITPGAQRRAAEALSRTDRAILAMRLAGTSDHDIAGVVGLSREALAGRCAAITVGALDAPRELHAG
ncbi:response regulator transcription factor [Solirubrobacter sp. CPCC 204708]|uniref:Response regulator transcription factor n=1 Tax=Solirubrobacter deserti TaxID=2282478 RepID=A0ABT4RM35_9ACTN|nr:response regulator transcription factor [Solirubrobacter deserti]MBE2318945.1 response regulator transcription factor [Solirubrobacter deserti]MDA0139330.1 response regulator transcription factor [Solirubrobacter deserti]